MSGDGIIDEAAARLRERIARIDALTRDEARLLLLWLDGAVPGAIDQAFAYRDAVPKPLRDAVWTAWRNGAGAGSAEPTAAITAAIRSIGGAS